MTINCVAIDDEPFSLAKIKDFISKVPYLNLVSSFSSAVEAMAFIKENQVDLIFLDIEMDHLTGIQMVEILSPKIPVIFVTAYDQYALKGYELNISDYLLKPYSFERFLKAVEKIYNTFQLAKPTDNFIFLKTEYKLEKVNFDDILYIESRGDYIYVVTSKIKILTLMTLKSILEKLSADKFIRVHKSYIVAINKIDAIEFGKIRINDVTIPIGDSYKENIMKRLSLDK